MPDVREVLERLFRQFGVDDVAVPLLADDILAEFLVLPRTTTGTEDKRKKLIEVAFAEPDPVKAAQAVAELRWMDEQRRANGAEGAR